MSLREIKKKLRMLGDKKRARVLQRFFKTGPGEYGEGDTFLGIRVPMLRKLAREYHDMPLAITRQMLKSPYHEERLLGLLILVRKYARSDEAGKERIYRLYLNNRCSINNWDLVDVTAEHIVGAYLMNREKTPLYRLARSRNLWERRIAILATFHAIKQDRFADTLHISTMLLSDEEDLIHKAVGWMLREVGKRDLRTEERYLQKHYRQMPRTMLRYAIERFPEAKRQRYLHGKI